MNKKLVDSLVQIISSLTAEEQFYLKQKLSKYSQFKTANNDLNCLKNKFPVNPLETMQPYAFLANPSDPVIPEDDWEFNQKDENSRL